MSPVARIEQLINKRNFRRLNVQYETFPRVRGTLFLRKDYSQGVIRFGRNVRINSKLEANPAGGIKTVLVTLREGSAIEIGDGTGISNSILMAAARITIGRQVYIGAGCKIYDTDFHSVHHEERIVNANTRVAPVTIEDEVFIGAHSIILKGVTIGRGAVIGAGSVVAKNIPPGEIWAGNPVRFIRKLDEGVEPIEPLSATAQDLIDGLPANGSLV